MPFKIIIDKGACIGCGSCAAICGEVFEMKADKSHAKKAVIKEMGCAKEAADACPVQCITIKEV